MQRYVLDSNVFIQAHRMYYPFDVFPSFWKKLIELSETGQIISIDKVKMELCPERNPDQLAQWCKNELEPSFFADTSECIEEYIELSGWINAHPVYLRSAKAEFLKTDYPDSWLVAYAKTHDCVVVTHEKSEPHRQNRVKIPDPCIHYNIPYVFPIEMFRALGVRL